jgi:putative nucleotidyltransferase with HDIG domain
VVPNRAECLGLLREYQIPEHILEHSRKVFELAICLCRLLNEQGERVDEAKVTAGAWLHDIAKMDGLHTGEDHSSAGAGLLKNLGYPEVAEIVRQHVILDDEIYHGPIGEAMIVHYADKRVKHTTLVSLKERFQDLKERYGKAPGAYAWLENLEERTLKLEARIFKRLPIPPESLKSPVEEKNPG